MSFSSVFIARVRLDSQICCACFALVSLLTAISTLEAQAVTPLQIVTDTLPTATVGVAYAQQLVVSGGSCAGSGVATSTIDDGALPGGLVVSSPPGEEKWTIMGTPAAAGSFRFTLHIRWTRTMTSPFIPACEDEAVKSLTIAVQTPVAQSSLAVDRPQVSTTYRIAHFPPAPELVRVTSVGAASVAFAVQAATDSGGNWLSVTPPGDVTPAALSISFTINGLQPGVYTGRVTVASGTLTPATIAVTLKVELAPIVLQVTPASLTFSYVPGAQVPPSQPLDVTVTGDNVLFQVDVAAPPNGKWLTVSPTGAATKATLNVSVDPKTLTPGAYRGVITVRADGVPNSAQTIPVTFNIQTTPALPAITANGVVNAANLSAAIAPGAWVSIFGSNLSTTARSWRDADFIGGKLPTALDGVSVTINGKAAAVAYVSPTQINVLAPDDTATGLVAVQVKSAAGAGDSILVLEQTAAPALFQFRAGATAYAAGVHANGAYLAGAALVQQGIAGTPAKPGETIVVFGTGFGATQPSISATALVPSPLTLASAQDLRVRIGGVDAAIAFAGLISPGLYQFNVVVPQLDDGDWPIVAEIRGLLTRADLMLSVQH